MATEARQQILEEPSVLEKLRRLIENLQHDIALRELMRKIADGKGYQLTGPANGDSGPVCPDPPPDLVFRKPYEALPRELADAPPEHAEARDLRGSLARLPLPAETRREIDREIDRLDRTPAASPEHGMIRTYLDWVLKLPWGKVTGATIDVHRARAVLDADHHDLDKVKDRIIEYLSVRRLRAERGVEALGEDAMGREPILCLVGPPGVGKTSLGQSIARALDRRFARVALGGIHDEAEIRGHRRTYIGAMPGRILQALCRCGAADPVLMLDEIDKLGLSLHGDPGAALLEVLDPGQNHAFVDSYLGLPFDLSRVLLLCTANTLDAIAAPLLDRMEVVAVAGYTDSEKLSITRRHLLPKAIAAHGLRPHEASFDDDAIRRVVRGYTREAGVRGLGREIGSVLRKVARRVSEGACLPVHVGAKEVPHYLGTPRFYDEVAERIDRPGVATGLAWMPTGGDILFVEATIMAGDEDRLVLTGMMGNVMRESAQAALSYLRSNGERFGVDARALERKTVHVHVPAGSIPKDGPSAGVTILTAIASQAVGRPARSDLGMTGEITLRGRILPVGGIKEKVLAAHRLGLRVIALPRRSQLELEELPDEVRAAIRFVLVESADEVLALALGCPL
jgi:ATP-dependent Lon protease